MGLVDSVVRTVQYPADDEQSGLVLAAWRGPVVKARSCFRSTLLLRVAAAIDSRLKIAPRDQAALAQRQRMELWRSQGAGRRGEAYWGADYWRALGGGAGT